ncbi:MAG: phosphoglucomutase (alpha-D-glucose-1,6-bisphosphate-dependent) [Candidatus Endonucleobacter bathymodioli]|uniref:Phosphoglucomutase n=1 Tax=Candidatus Endonucleibacter bathymodioli TaxID=539814 RepID=A0AA90NUE5_9GAMM|nr:phosphoglucomutase (alpha-D-glucose-1,6-bisphosphate-dependent) [Candidatus Endonucleobacter bathymodioli]
MHPLAGQLVTDDMLVNIPRLVSDYYVNRPNPENEAHRVIFGTSGHRGSSFVSTFNESHILAISQGICDYRQRVGITGPLFLGMDTHALSEPALVSAVEVLTANNIEVLIQKGRGYTPTPVISHAIVNYNLNNTRKADGIVITPSHNPPEYGGLKYNPPHGGGAEIDVTSWIEQRANDLLAGGLKLVRRTTFAKAMESGNVCEYDYITPYVTALDQVVNMEVINKEGLKLGVDPLGGSGLNYWEYIANQYNLNLEIVNRAVDPTFSFMPLDKDGKVRIDCSSAYAMSRLIKLKDKFDIAFANDPDADRHGIVTSQYGLLSPNHYLAVAIDYLYRHRTDWPAHACIGKTLVSSSMIDRLANGLGRKVAEVPVGFKWFVNGLSTGEIAFGGEESAGASFLKKNGKTWCTDKDGFILSLLAAEITAVTGKDPGEYYKTLTEQYGAPLYQRVEAPATNFQKRALSALSPDHIKTDRLAGDPIVAKLTRAPWNNAPIGGLKVITEKGWFAARPSGTEAVYKMYTESFEGEDHLKKIQVEAQAIISEVFSSA